MGALVFLVENFLLRVVTGSGAVRWIGQAPVTLQVDI
jgi:hypothetical protein